MSIWKRNDMGDESVRIGLPCDNDGFMLLQCPKCGERFKVLPEDAKDDSVVAVHCALCGLTSRSFVTDELVSLAHAKALNYVNEELYSVFSELHRKTKGQVVSFGKPKKPQKEYEPRLWDRLDSMELFTCKECGRKSKARRLVVESACHCPYCGVIDYGN